MFAVKNNTVSATDAEVNNLVYADQMDLLYRSLPVSMLVSIALAVIWLLLLSPVVDSSLPNIWFALFVAAALLRIACAYLFKRHRLRHRCAFWESLFVLGVIITAGLWAVAVAWAFPLLDAVHQTLLVLFVAGLQMGALSTAGARPWPMPVFMLITSSPLLWHWFGDHNRLPDAVALMLIFYLLVIAASGRRLYLTTEKGLRLGHESGRSEQRFRSIVDSAGDALLVVNQQGRVIDVNKTACHLTNYSRDELIGMEFGSISALSDADFRRLLDRLHAGEVVVSQTDYRNANGDKIPVDVSTSLYSIGGESYVVVLARDLSLQRQRERELQTSRRKLELHVSQTPLGVIDWDSDFKITAWNPGAEKIFGYRADEIIGRHAYETIVEPSSVEQIKEIWRELMNNSGGHRSVNENVTRSGKIIICDWYNTSLLDEQGRVIGAASMVMDISDQVAAQKALFQAKQRAESANMSKTKFLSRMSHELRTPLNAIIGFSGLLRKEGANKDFVDAIESSGLHLLSMIDEILDLSRVEQGKLNLNIGKVMLASVVREAVTSVTPMAQLRFIVIDVCHNCSVLAVQADHACLRQVLINLLSNAVKYSNDHSHIDVRAQIDGVRVKLEVRDSGRGIAKDKQHLLFREFERAGAERTNVSGTGIGLMISRHMIEEMGGEIGFESEEGKGSCFWLLLPVAGSATESTT